ncbi:MAG: PH domain-containing protein, partial [Bifidobacteriaceae bacterium]|nr:PH domain-containing protein [Bifidobacteriaceae bacterium]
MSRTAKPRRPSAVETDQGGEWNRFHPLTPLLKTWIGFAALVALAINASADYWESVRDVARRIDLAWPLAAIALVLAMVFLGAWAAWRRARFRVTDDSIQLVSGLVFRVRRHVRLDRVRSVDTIHTLVSRLFGLVALKIEAAGGADSALSLAFFTKPDADRWRRVILSRAAQVQPGAGAPARAGAAVAGES